MTSTDVSNLHPLDLYYHLLAHADAAKGQASEACLRSHSEYQTFTKPLSFLCSVVPSIFLHAGLLMLQPCECHDCISVTLPGCAGLDNVRNMTGSPIAGIDPHELLDVRPLNYGENPLRLSPSLSEAHDT